MGVEVWSPGPNTQSRVPLLEAAEASAAQHAESVGREVVEMKRLTIVLALAVFGGAALGGCGGSTTTIVTETTTPAATGAAPATSTPTQSAPTPSGGSSPSPNGSGTVAGLPNQCSNGLAASQDVSCSLASNVFYEYYEATQNGGNTSSLTAWSGITKTYYGVDCSTGNGLISCSISGTTDPNASVAITQAALDAYSPQQASAYASSHDVGPG
jgi:hypothetical protein